MRVAIISSLEGASWGGSEELWSLVALKAVTHGHVVVASVKGWPESAHQVRQLAQSGVSVRFRTEPDNLSSHMSELLGQKPDFFLLSLGDNGPSALRYVEGLFRLRIPYFILCQNAAPWWWWPDEIANRVRSAFANARAVFFVSEQNRNHTETSIGTRLGNAQIVFNPLSVTSAEKLAWPISDAPRFACIGRLQPAYKGQDILFEVLAREEWRMRAVEVSIYGTGESQATLQRQVARLNLTSVHFKGFQSPDLLWCREQMLVLPSRTEGMPLVLQDAMHLGRPAVVTDIGGCASLVQEDVTGFVAEAPTVRHFAAALEKAWIKRSCWRAMGIAAHNTISAYLPQDPANHLLEKMIGLVSSSLEVASIR